MKQIIIGLLILLSSCMSMRAREYERSIKDVHQYLEKLTGRRFSEVVQDNHLGPLFNSRASYENTILAARRAIRWRIKVANGIESGAVNLAMMLSILLDKKPLDK